MLRPGLVSLPKKLRSPQFSHPQPRNSAFTTLSRHVSINVLEVALVPKPALIPGTGK